MTSSGLPDDTVHDVIIIGAGPAGLGVAAVTAGAGLLTLVLDENMHPGGQIYRAASHSPFPQGQVLGKDYWRKGTRMIRRAYASGAHIIPRAIVWGITPDHVVMARVDGQPRRFAARCVVLAGGAMERPFPIPGWTLPGVMTVGAAQTMLKASGVVPPTPMVIAGRGPLIWLLAAQYRRAGQDIAAILITAADRQWWKGLAALPFFLLSGDAWYGLRLLASAVMHRVPVHRGVMSICAEGTACLEQVRWSGKNGQDKVLPARTLLLHHGVVPNPNLAMALGVPHVWDRAQASFRPAPAGTAGYPDGIVCVGDAAGIGGSRLAALGGRMAGQAIVAARGRSRRNLLNWLHSVSMRARIALARRGRMFVDFMFRPASHFRQPADETVICRCEGVIAGQVRSAAREGCIGPNQAKAFLRCGMGPCQGRLCGLTVSDLIAQTRDRDPADVGYLNQRLPARPATLGDMAAMPADSAAIRAVTPG